MYCFYLMLIQGAAIFGAFRAESVCSGSHFVNLGFIIIFLNVINRNGILGWTDKISSFPHLLYTILLRPQIHVNGFFLHIFLMIDAGFFS